MMSRKIKERVVVIVVEGEYYQSIPFPLQEPRRLKEIHDVEFFTPHIGWQSDNRTTRYVLERILDGEVEVVEGESNFFDYWERVKTRREEYHLEEKRQNHILAGDWGNEMREKLEVE